MSEETVNDTGINVTPEGGNEGNSPVVTPPVTPPATPVAPGPWDGMTDDLRGYVQNKGFKDAPAAVEAYRNLEKLMGVPKDRLVKLPAKADDKDGWSEVYNKLGRPETAEGYKLEIPKELGDENFAKWAQGTFHELGLTKAQGETLAAKWNEYAGGLNAKVAETYKADVDKQEGELKNEWGMAYDQNIALARKAAQKLGIEGDAIDKLEASMGYGGVMKFFHKIGSQVGEDSFVGGSGSESGGFGVLTPQAAKDRINALRGDPDFVKSYTGGNADARAEMEKLHRMAYPGETTL